MEPWYTTSLCRRCETCGHVWCVICWAKRRWGSLMYSHINVGFVSRRRMRRRARRRMSCTVIDSHYVRFLDLWIESLIIKLDPIFKKSTLFLIPGGRTLFLGYSANETTTWGSVISSSNIGTRGSLKATVSVSLICEINSFNIQVKTKIKKNLPYFWYQEDVLFFLAQLSKRPRRWM